MCTIPDNSKTASVRFILTNEDLTYKAVNVDPSTSIEECLSKYFFTKDKICVDTNGQVNMKDKVGYGRVLYLKERKKGVKDVPSEELPDISSKRTNVTPVASQFRVQATPDWRKIKLHHGPLFYVKATQHSEKTVEELITFTTELDARKYKRILDENGEEVEPTSLVGNRCYFLVVLIKGTAWRMDRGDQ